MAGESGNREWPVNSQRMLPNLIYAPLKEVPDTSMSRSHEHRSVSSGTCSRMIRRKARALVIPRPLWFLFVLVCFSTSFCRASAATTDDRITASEIMRRSAAAQNIHNTRSFSNARIATLTENGRRWSELVVVKSPNKLLIRDIYPWLNLTVYRGFDGKRAWTSSNFGGGGLVDASSGRLIKSMVAWYTSSEMVPGRWPVRLKRLPDEKIDGRSYFTIRVSPLGGNPSTVWVDKRDYSSKAVSSRSDRYFECVRPSLRSICRHQEIISGGRIVGSVEIQPIQMKIDDTQFEMPEMLDDWTTQWLLDRYAKVLGPRNRSTLTLRGEMREIADSSAPTFTTEWSLETTRPLAFINSQAFHGRVVWRAIFDGKEGTVDRLGTVIPATYVAAILGMAYNKCELTASECGVRVTRLANIGIGGRSYYALGVTSIQTPSLWYTVLLDPSTGLPYALWLRAQLLYFDDYALSGPGERIPTTWTFQSTTDTFKVTRVRVIEPVPH